MEKVADVAFEYLTTAQKERLTLYRAGIQDAFEKTAKKSDVMSAGMNLAKSFLIPLAAGFAGHHVSGKIREKKENEMHKELQAQIERNRNMLSSLKEFEPHRDQFHEVFDEVAGLAPHVAANPKMMTKIMAKYGPHTTENLELMQMEALKSLDHKLQEISQRQHRIDAAKAKGKHYGELMGQGFAMSLPDMSKTGSVEASEADALVGLMFKRLALIKTAAKKNPASLSKYLKMFAPGVAIASLPAAGFAYAHHKEKKDLQKDIDRSFKIVSKNPDIQRMMTPESVHETFNAIATFAPSVARNPAAARSALLMAGGSEGLNPHTIKALVDIERSGNDSKKNTMKDYVMPAIGFASAGLGAGAAYHKMRENAEKADFAEREANRARWAK